MHICQAQNEEIARHAKDSAQPKEMQETGETADVSTSEASQALNWMRFVVNKTNAETSTALMRDIGLAVRRRQERNKQKQREQSKKMQAELLYLQDALRKQASQTLAAHQMLFQESKRTLAHCKRFKTELVPVGLEEQCQQALVKCQQVLGLELGVEYLP